MEKYFKKSDLNFLDYIEFDFEELEKITSKEFIEELQRDLHSNYIRKAVIEEENEYKRNMYFYANGGITEDIYTIITVFYLYKDNKHQRKDSFFIESISSYEFEKLGLAVVEQS
ncbi:hypothetical protein V1503_24890 [Bacillus sp. SCS-151]|uniref:hypothetical protein n=1 Tax=Nanhaiella sioensis TaxID=3115293 RepID=UPI0039784524